MTGPALRRGVRRARRMAHGHAIEKNRVVFESRRCVDEDTAWIQMAVNNFSFVQGVQGGEQLPGPRYGAQRCNPANVPEDIFEALSTANVEYESRLAIDIADHVDDRLDVGVAKIPGARENLPRHTRAPRSCRDLQEDLSSRADVPSIEQEKRRVSFRESDSAGSARSRHAPSSETPVHC